MCGIIGYTGVDQAVPVLLDSLKKLEYRGYDSAGIAVVSEEGIRVEKTIGKVDCLVEKVKEDGQPESSCGIGHTRWATHGVPSDVNAHPHLSYDGKFAIVHNGIIENFAELKAMLMEKGIEFQSETDTEVIVQLLAYYYDGDTAKTLRKCVSKLEGSYALGVLSKEMPGTVYAARVASPLIIGLGADANYFASDITALVSHTKNVIDLDDGELAELTPDGVKVFDALGNQIEKTPRRITWDVAAAEKSGYDHFMLKEIMEQPAALKATIEPRVKDEEVSFEDLDLDVKKFNRILITACGSAYHAGCVGKYVLEKLCRIPVEVDVASELRYRDPVIDEKTLTIAVSQSGETADTIAAIKECKAKGSTTLAIVNVVGSSIARLVDYPIYTWAGPEIAVATTKGYTTQVVIFDMLAVWLAKKLGTIDEAESKRLTSEILSIPERAQRSIHLNSKVESLADLYHDMSSVFFIGRNLDYAVGLEASLKLKEISYIHSEAYAAGELKHGTIALIDEGQLVIALCCHEALFDKTVSNIQQVKARGAEVLAVSLEGNKQIFKEADEVLTVPNTDPILMPVIEVIPLQLFAYYVAKKNGCDIDKPKNLAKSVTVE